MAKHSKIIVILAFITIGCLAGCPQVLAPPHPLVQTIRDLPEDVQGPVRSAIWAHGNPYNWDRAENLVMDVIWSDLAAIGDTPLQGRRYTIDLDEDSMRVDSISGVDTTAIIRRGRWQLFMRGQRVAMPDAARPQQSPDINPLLNHSAGEMRALRTIFSMPFMMLEPGVELQSMGIVESRGAGNRWNVIKATFDPQATGHIRGDSMQLYLDPESQRIDRALIMFSGAPFHGVPHWAEYSDYRPMPSGLQLPHRIDFNRTDASGAADLGRTLTIDVTGAEFNMGLPKNIFRDATVRPPQPRQGDEDEQPTVRRIGRDNIAE